MILWIVEAPRRSGELLEIRAPDDTAWDLLEGHLMQRHVQRLVTVLALLGVAASSACSAVDDPSSTDQAAVNAVALAQMNDVSVLYPLPKTQDEFKKGYISASDKGRGGTLLPYEVIASSGLPESAAGALHPGQDVDMVWRDLKVVAFRIDPCFANIGKVTNAANCKNQLRLVLQDVSYGKNGGTVIDGAVHAFYSLTRAELVEMVKEMIAIRQASTDKPLGPLAVNPLLTKEGVLGNAGKRMKALVLKYAGPTNLTRFTAFVPMHLATSWSFDGFDVANGVATPMVIPTLPDDATSAVFFAGFVPGKLLGTFTPATTAKDNISLLGNFDDAKLAGPAKTKAAFDAGLRIENPNKHSPDTIDCTSCHVSGPALSMASVAFNLPLTGNPNAFTLQSPFVSDADQVQTTPVDPKDNTTSRHLHVFSYRDSTPMIARRVIHETAAVVDYLDTEVLPKR